MAGFKAHQRLEVEFEDGRKMVREKKVIQNSNGRIEERRDRDEFPMMTGKLKFRK